MRPLAIQSVPGLDPNGTPFERFRQFASIARISKTEVDKQVEDFGSAETKQPREKRARKLQ